MPPTFRVIRSRRRQQPPTRRPEAEREEVPAVCPLNGQPAAGDPSPPRNGARRGRRPPDGVGQRRQLTEAAAITAALGLENIRSWCLDLRLTAFTSSVPLRPRRPASSRKVHRLPAASPAVRRGSGSQRAACSQPAALCPELGSPGCVLLCIFGWTCDTLPDVSLQEGNHGDQCPHRGPGTRCR
jgi:hypothetical protein